MLQKKRDWNEPINESSELLYVPLKRLSVDATIRSFAADVTITQVFRNDETVPIEAVYCFPIEEQAAVYAFVAHIDDREIVAQLKEKRQAQEEYNDALREHHGAYLLEQDEDSQDNFIINVGALPPTKECRITISYVTELDCVQNGTKTRFVVPTTIAPRYNPIQGGISSPAGTATEYVQSAPYTIEFHCRVEKFGISRVSSTSHPIQIDLNQEDIYMIEFAQNNTHLDRDIIVDMEFDQNRSNTIVAVESGAIMISFTPTDQDCRSVMDDGNFMNEFIFVVDCSGSMDEENKIGLARQAMLLFLKSLPVNCHFNIIRFGSQHYSLFNDITAIYNNDNAGQAEKLINEMKADLGGTELLRPLQWLAEHPTAQGYSRQIFLLSDGEISNVDEVLNLCRSMATSTRIFSFGLGASPSRSLIKGLARTTNGRFVFIPPATNVDVYVGEQLQKALQPCITNTRIKFSIDSTLVNIVPTSTPPVFINDRLIIYAVAKDEKSTWFDHSLSVELYSEQHRLGEAKINRIPSVSNDRMIARLAAKALILELQHSKLPSSGKKNMKDLRQSQFKEHDEQQTTASNDENSMTKKTIEKRIIDISLKYNILSPYTAFVGIEKRANTSNANMILRKVPIQISTDNQYLKYLETAVSQMRHKQQRSQMCYEALSERGDYDKTQWRYDNAYKEAQEHFHDTLEHRMEADQHYYEARDRYDKVRQNLHRFQDENTSSSNVCEEMDLHLVKFSEHEKKYAERCFEEAEESLRRRDQEYQSANRLCERAHDSLRRCENEKQSAAIHYKMARASLRDSNDPGLSSKMHYTEALQRYEHEKRSSRKSQTAARNVDQAGQDMVRLIIKKQKFDGLWDVDTKIIEQLTGKTLSDFQQLTDMEILVSAIIVAVLETRFASLSSMWYGIVQKARKCLTDMLDKDNNKLNTLLEDIRNQL